MSTLGIVQARMDSTRLSGKVLRRLAGRTVLERVIRAAQASGVCDELVVATTEGELDDQIVAECERIGVPVYRGPEDDSDVVLRFTADSPMLDPELIALAVKVFTAAPYVDYLSTAIHHTLPRGLDVEVVRTEVLRSIDKLATDYHRTHVTSYIYTHPEEYTVLGLTLQPDLSHLRLTLDTEDDWRLIEAVVAHFGDRPVPVRTLADWLSGRPELAVLNAHVRQKELAQA
jgi:spore coat polysaccharide biosynthesis protein SpsF